MLVEDLKTIEESYPLCFAKQEDYDHWRKLAQDAHDHVSPCTDCTKPYRAKMLEQGRCDKRIVKRDFSYEPNKKHKVITPQEAATA